MGGTRPIVAVVAETSDALATATAERLREHGVPTRSVPPGGLSLLPVELARDVFLVDESPVAAVFWRAAPTTCMSDGFQAAERAFCDAETGATWLGAMQLPSVLSINRFDAGAWYSGIGWPVWRRLLARHGVAVEPLAVGDVELAGAWEWRPYASFERLAVPDAVIRRVLGTAAAPLTARGEWLSVCGEVLGDATPNANVRWAAALLARAGVSLATVGCDDDGRIAVVDALPTVPSSTIAAAARTIAERMYAHWRRW